jgi:hypothetical protein
MTGSVVVVVVVLSELGFKSSEPPGTIRGGRKERAFVWELKFLVVPSMVGWPGLGSRIPPYIILYGAVYIIKL